LAAMQGREYVKPDDVKHLAPHVLAHRLIMTTRTRLRGNGTDTLMKEIIDAVPVPVETLALP
jgi:MoxR-like ATPase